MVALARHRLLMLDYDGTVAPFVVDRDQARPLPRALEKLRQLSAAEHTDVAIVTGRPVQEIQHLIGPLPLTIMGEHGWDRRDADGRVIRWPVPPPVSESLDRAE